MFKWLILAGGAYLIYKGLKSTFSGWFQSDSSEPKVEKGETKEDAVSYRADDVIDVEYREVKPDDSDEEK